MSSEHEHNGNQPDDGNTPIAEDTLREAYQVGKLWPITEFLHDTVTNATESGKLTVQLNLDVETAALLRDAVTFCVCEFDVDAVEAEAIALATADDAEQESAADASAATLAAIQQADADGTIRKLVGKIAEIRGILSADLQRKDVSLRLTRPMADLVGQLILAASDQLGGLNALASDSGACMPELN